MGVAYIRALKSEGSLSPPIPVGGGAVDTNDSCINAIRENKILTKIHESTVSCNWSMIYLSVNVRVVLPFPNLEYVVCHLGLNGNKK